MTNKNIVDNKSKKNILDFGNILTNKKVEDKKSNNDIISNEDNFKFSTTKNEQFSFDMSVIETLEGYKIN